ncbi:MAG: HD domain-containing protein [Candidatus Kapabacteria bacterium]|nr:HD domain-containing protein [Ignavibacteriota bacterium]MCW5884632.1 HD domain-containing protein [Candidatus Kapabacteria bacterium]
MLYSRTYFSKEELENALNGIVDPVELNRILSAYDMADMAYSDKKSFNGSPYFFHTTRVCKILVSELGLTEPEILIAALLHDIFEASNEISPEIINYNFGAYVTYLLTILKDDFAAIKKYPMPVNDNINTLKIPSDDYLIIWLGEHLDNFRSLEVSPMFNPINYILNIISTLFPVAEKSENPAVKKLLHELKQERNKILG